MSEQTAPYASLTPETILQAIESVDYRPSGGMLALNSYENRVYQVGIEDTEPIIAKFYRPERWSEAQILEEHELCFMLLEYELPVVAPLTNPEGRSLFDYGGFHFALFPRRGGHAPELDNLDNLYTLGRPTTLRENQTKQVSLLTASQVPVEKEFRLQGSPYYYRGRQGDLGQKLKVGVFVEFENRQENNLGMPLPKGIVRVYKQDSEGRPQFIGEDRIDHTPENETVRLKLGDAFDVTASRKQTDFRKLGGDSRYNYRFESAYEIVMKNAKPEAVTVTVAEPMPGDWRVLQENHPHEKAAADTALWKIKVPAKGETALNYRVEVKY